MARVVDPLVEVRDRIENLNFHANHLTRKLNHLTLFLITIILVIAVPYTWYSLT